MAMPILVWLMSMTSAITSTSVSTGVMMVTILVVAVPDGHGTDLGDGMG